MKENENENEAIGIIGQVGCVTVMFVAVLMFGLLFLADGYYDHQENMAEIQNCGEIELDK